jgi:hypothetical protein
MWHVEESPLGRIVVPPVVPLGAAVFCTTRDYPGRVVADEICRFVHGRFGMETSLTTCTQVHGATVVRAEHERAWRECDSCDALWTDQKDVTLGIKIADCLPVGIVDPEHGVIANAHSGWRGAVQGIAAGTVDAIEQATTFSAATAYAYLGPSIRACCFEVGDEVAERFESQFVDRTRAKPHVDLVGYTTAILRGRGFADERIFDSGLCTRCEGSIFHSYRRDGAGGGRNLMFVAQ